MPSHVESIIHERLTALEKTLEYLFDEHKDTIIESQLDWTPEDTEALPVINFNTYRSLAPHQRFSLPPEVMSLYLTWDTLRQMHDRQIEPIYRRPALRIVEAA